MAIVEAVLAVIGLGFVLLMIVTLLKIAFGWDQPEWQEPSTFEDPAQPYREALYAAMRIHQAAQEAEHQIFTEASLHMERSGGEQHESR
jgi:hypothetical protein